MKELIEAISNEFALNISDEYFPLYGIVKGVFLDEKPEKLTIGSADEIIGFPYIVFSQVPSTMKNIYNFINPLNPTNRNYATYNIIEMKAFAQDAITAAEIGDIIAHIFDLNTFSMPNDIMIGIPIRNFDPIIKKEPNHIASIAIYSAMIRYLYIVQRKM